MQPRNTLSSWQALTAHAEQMKKNHMKDFFAADKHQFENFSIKAPSLLLDYSKNLVTQQTMKKLRTLAEECNVSSWRDKMFDGERINSTENRAVLHTALRNQEASALHVDGENVSAQVLACLTKMRIFSEKVRGEHWKGYTGKCITDVVNIGVGGSNLGTQMVTEALKPYSDHCVKVHYVSNVDGTQIANVLRPLNPETVLFIVSSKTFTTTETMINANTARQWLISAAFDEAAVAKHFVAVSANSANVIKFGIAADNVFDMWDWVGGRFSLWSAIGLSLIHI